ncbi:MAG: ferritin family protein [Kosmotogaceae bacterium]|nr:ferritin family protein [Kosmotogaceae bacterium]
MLSPHEILDLALKIEEDGASFYREIAESVENDSQSSLFGYLSKQEEGHAETFRSLLREYEEETLELINRDDSKAYVEDLVSGSIFSRNLRDYMSSSDYREMISLAIEAEKKSIEFYESILENARFATADALERIIEEENNHIELLKGMI